MATIKRIDDMEAIYQGAFKKARAELEVTSFGLQVIDLPPGNDQYPSHDHSHDGQEEVYLALRGGGEIEIDGERHPLEPDVLVAVPPAATRKVVSGPDGLRLLAIGGVPGAAYKVTDFTELGQPDPAAT